MLTAVQRERRRYLGQGDPFRPGPMTVPVPTSRRGQILAKQLRGEAEGQFRERFLEITPFGTIASGASATVKVQVPSCGGRFVRLVAMRGVLQNSSVLPLTGLEFAFLMLRMVLNGNSDLIVAQVGQPNTASFDALFSHTANVYIVPAQLDASLTSDPWMWWSAPPRLRTGDRLTVTLTNTAVFEEAPDLTPELTLRIVDARWWERFYLGRED